MMLRKMSDNNEYFLFEDRLRKEFRVYILKDLLADDEYITHTQRQKKSAKKDKKYGLQ